MTPIESRLRRALADEAEARTVDVTRLRADLARRLAVPAPRRPRPGALAAVAASVVLVAGLLLAVPAFHGDDPHADGSVSVGTVADGFSCFSPQPVDLSGAQDEFRPSLEGRRPKDVATEYGAPRWVFEDHGETAELRLGNGDGTLGSVSQYERRDGEWRLTSSVACGVGDPSAPTPDALRLGLHQERPWSPSGVLRLDGPARPALVDDRPVYDYSGLITRHRTIYVAPCRDAVCFASGQPDSGVRPELRIDRGRDADVLGQMCYFYLPEDLVGRTSPYVVQVAWDARGVATGFAVTVGGDRFRGTVFGNPTWDGARVWLALVPVPEAGEHISARLVADDEVLDSEQGPLDCG